MCSRYMQKPHESQWKAAKCILCYLRGTTHMSILYSASANVHLFTFSDIDWWVILMSDALPQHSFSLVFGRICYCSKKQQGVGLYSTEAKYASAIHVEKHLSWMQMLLGS